MTNLTYQEVLFQAVKELLWMAITAMVIYAILYPITHKIDFIYWKINAFFIFVSITCFRYSVTFKSLPFLRPGWIRFLLFTINLSLFVYIAQYEQKFISLSDNFYIEDFGFPKIFIDEASKQQLFKYLYTEIVLFGTGSLVLISAFQLRLIVSYWQYYKHKANTLLED